MATFEITPENVTSRLNIDAPRLCDHVGPPARHTPSYTVYYVHMADQSDEMTDRIRIRCRDFDMSDEQYNNLVIVDDDSCILRFRH